MSTAVSHGESSSIHGWRLQEIRLLEPFCERAKPRLIGSPTCNADTVAIVLHDYCARVNSSTATGSV